MMKKIEILAPAGNWEMLVTAVKAGADSVYLGISSLNMRATARNFADEELDEITEYCHERNVNVYLCINTIVYEHELLELKKVIKKAKEAGVDAIVAWDLAVIKEAKKLGFEIHLSTQASASNSSAIEEYKKLGIKRVVLARECSIEDIRKIKKKVKGVKIEAFCHGAMCVSVSGRCFISEQLYGQSANRGKCIQPCRRRYIVKDPETGKELELNNNYVMSPRDMCTIKIVDKLIEAGVDCLKIEGRARSPEYVKTTVECYREAIELYYKKSLTKKKKEELYEKLKNVFNRGFSTGFYMGKPIDEWTDEYGSKSRFYKEYVGKVINYFSKINVAEIKVESNTFKENDVLMIIGPTTGCIESKAGSIHKDNKRVKKTVKGESYGVKVCDKVRKNDKVYVLVERKQNKK